MSLTKMELKTILIGNFKFSTLCHKYTSMKPINIFFLDIETIISINFKFKFNNTFIAVW